MRINMKGQRVIYALLRKQAGTSPSISKGFTLIELILYIAIVTIMLSALVPFAWAVIGGGVKSTTQEEVASQARYLGQRLSLEIRNAKAINSVSPTRLSLQEFNPVNDPTIIDLSGGFLRIKQGAKPVLNLNSTDVALTSLVFTNRSSADTKQVQFAFTLSSATAQVRQEYQQTVNFEGSAELRSF